MNLSQVAASEAGEPEERKPNRLVYRGQWMEKRVKIIYSFEKGGLAQCGYLVTETHLDRNRYFEDFETFQKALEQQYGPPAKKRVKWTNPMFKNLPDHRGLALSRGHVSQGAMWSLPCTRIGLMLMGGGSKIACLVKYEPTCP